jgi:hypothetical protein
VAHPFRWQLKISFAKRGGARNIIFGKKNIPTMPSLVTNKFQLPSDGEDVSDGDGKNLVVILIMTMAIDIFLLQ